MSDKLEYDLLKEAEQDQLIIAIEQIMLEGDAHNSQNFNLQYWLWQYKNLPKNLANVYIVRNEEKEILGYYHVPIYEGKNHKGEATAYAMIQDVAISSKLRGRGVFKDLAIFANKHLDSQNIQVVYTFPNTKSIHTFEKYNNFACIQTLPAYILPLSISSIIKSKINIPILPNITGFIIDAVLKLKSIKKNASYSLQMHEKFNTDIVTIYENYNQNYAYGLIKNLQYLNWRFVEKGKHFIFTCSANGSSKAQAVAVFKIDTILNMRCLLLMDFAYVQNAEQSILQLIQQVKENQMQHFNQQFALIFTTANSNLNSNFAKVGFFKIPESRNPRPLNLLVRTLEKNAQSLKSNNWNITLSDWDVF